MRPDGEKEREGNREGKEGETMRRVVKKGEMGLEKGPHKLRTVALTQRSVHHSGNLILIWKFTFVIVFFSVYVCVYFFCCCCSSYCCCATVGVISCS